MMSATPFCYIEDEVDFVQGVKRYHELQGVSRSTLNSFCTLLSEPLGAKVKVVPRVIHVGCQSRTPQEMAENIHVGQE